MRLSSTWGVTLVPPGCQSDLPQEFGLTGGGQKMYGAIPICCEATTIPWYEVGAEPVTPRVTAPTVAMPITTDIQVRFFITQLP